MSHQSSIAKASVTSYSPEPEAKQPENKTEEKEFESLEEALTGEQQSRPFIPPWGRMTPKHGTGLRYMEITMQVTYVYRGIAYTKFVK